MVNAQVEKMFGHTRSELIGQSIETLIPERFHAVNPTLHKDYLEGLSARLDSSRELFALRKDGSEFPIEIGLNSINNYNGKTVVLASLTDITIRKNQEESFRRIVEAAPNGMVMVDASGESSLLLYISLSKPPQDVLYW